MSEHALTPPQPQLEAGPRPRRLVRRTDEKWLGGVCAGFAEWAAIDVTLVRILTVVGVVLGFGTVAVAYVVAWFVMPTE